MATRLDEQAKKAFLEQQSLKFLREQGYQISGNGQITPPLQQHTQSYGPPRRRNIIREKLADRNTALELLDRSRPKPDWYKGHEELVLQELEIQLLGIMDYQHPFN